MTRQNIWEIVTINDLVKILKEHENKFVIVGLTLQTTPDDMVKIIKKFLKDYSKIYKNITFLYLNVLDKDLGRINILKKDKSEYPFVYHIYNTSDIFVSVNRVNKQTLYESMYAVEKYYKKDLENYLSNLSNEKSNNVIINNNLAFNNNLNNEQLNNNDKDYDENQEQERQQINDLQNEETQQKVLEHENLLNRIVIFEEKKKIHNLKFLEDIQKRKKEEKNKR